MFRKTIAIILLVSFVAISTSGVAMLIVGKASFTLRMHPVHLLFGVLFVLSASCHLFLNFKNIVLYLKTKMLIVVLSALTILLVSLYAMALSHDLPEPMKKELNDLRDKAEYILEGEED